MQRKGYKISLVGQSGVGKTCILTRYIKGVYCPTKVPTIGANFLTKELAIKSQRIDLNIWDTAGQEVYRSLTPMYYRNAVAAIVIFDVTSKGSFDAVKEWVFELRANEPDILIFLCGNKIDDVENRIIEMSEIQNLATELNISFAETSASTGIGIEQLFQMVVLEILKKLEATEDKPIINVADKTSNEDSHCCKG